MRINPQNEVDQLIKISDAGFSSQNANPVYIKKALEYLKIWLTDIDYVDYKEQIIHLIKNENWDYLLESFYQVIPFGTGGRRGEVGVGPNRINPWTIKASAQGHSQYLLKKYGEKAKRRGVVFAYDVREFSGNKYLSDDLHNPLKDLTSKMLAIAAAEVYAANGIKVHLFDDIRSTPELSFAIRHLNAVAGDMFSASHNPADHNGKKVYDKFGGQLIPPEDEELVDEVTKNINGIKQIPFDKAVKIGMVVNVDPNVDNKYLKAATAVSLSNNRNIDIIYTPLHGCGITSVYKALKKMGFNISKDPRTSNPSGKFENVIFNIPNPEVIQSFNTTLKFAKEKNADIILNSDPDADRIGIMAKHKGKWIFINGNEIAGILTEYVIQKRKKLFKGDEVLIKTTVTTNLITKICENNDVKIIGDLLIGFKYIGSEMNKLEQQGQINGLLFGCEESHGYLAGNYARDKDAITAAIWLAELAAELKKEGKTLIDYLDDIYSEYGYYINYLTEIRLLGASGKEKIDKIQDSLRKNIPSNFGEFIVEKHEDCYDRKPIVSDTDKSSKDVLIFKLKSNANVESMKVTVRPSGTEPKIKIYFEIGARPIEKHKLPQVKKELNEILEELEKSVMLHCFKSIDVDFPERGFLLFWQLPLDTKMKYFEIEPQIERLKTVKNNIDRKNELFELLAFLGSDPIEKIDKAFQAKYGESVLKYLCI